MVTTRSHAAKLVALRGGNDASPSDEAPTGPLRFLAGGEVQLLIVAALYGSLTVAFRLLYSQEGPPVPSMASFVRGLIAAACFIPSIVGKQPAGEGPKNRAFWLAAVELAWWNLGAQGLQNAGLLFTEASRASFLTQTSVVLTPVLAMFAGDKVGANVWVACVLALVGVVTIASAESAAAATSAVASLGGLNIGDILCLAGAASWSMYILRLTRFMTSGLPAMALQAYKTIFLAVMYGVWVGVFLVRSMLLVRSSVAAFCASMPRQGEAQRGSKRAREATQR